MPLVARAAAKALCQSLCRFRHVGERIAELERLGVSGEGAAGLCERDLVEAKIDLRVEIILSLRDASPGQDLRAEPIRGGVPVSIFGVDTRRDAVKEAPLRGVPATIELRRRSRVDTADL